ncbi:MAG: hypothetical protein A3G25_09670 [Betaproteobacteria bacterium RIFCSPLOWO2_12_FULL_63_13]|nr:MAG: hypothetical protein A3G25_09670 [Betaproteobacteria bacterium RIFCSPLOWO2_12_FULL_63_13]
MCLVLFSWRAHPEHVLVVAANRDEFHHRPSCAAAFWNDSPDVLAGRDLTALGTWLGVSRSGRFAAITNYRNPAERMATAPSRGHLVADFLSASKSPHDYFSGIAPHAGQYNGFSMLAADFDSIAFFSNRQGAIAEIEPGVHGLSNHLLDTPWPKVIEGKARLEVLLQGKFDPQAYLELLGDTEPAYEAILPDTGVGIEFERRFSSIRIVAGDYGTRCSSVLRIGLDGKADFWERSYDREGNPGGTVHFSFAIPGVQKTKS